MVPEGWTKIKLGKVVEINSGVAPSSLSLADIGRYPYVKVEDMNNCNKYQTLSRTYTNDEGKKVPAGAILFPKRGAAIMNNKVRVAATDLYLDSNMMALLPNEGVSSEFLFYSLIREKLYRIADTSTIPQINNKHINPYPFLLPPLPEQKKIAETLSTWDQAIAATERLLENSKKRRKALMQQLLTGKKRLPGFDGHWERHSIGDLLKEVRRAVDWNDDDDFKLLSVKRRSGGVVLREVLKGHQILTKKMKLARSGDFLISKMQVVHGASGLVGDQFDGCHISDSYIALIPRNTQTFAIEFFAWLSKQRSMYHKAFLSSYGVHIEKLTFNFQLYLKEQILIPPTISEQRLIVQVLDTSEQEISALEIRLDRLKEEKKALMQQLLTGKRRVQVDTEAA